MPITFRSGAGGVGLKVKDARESLLAKEYTGFFFFFFCLSVLGKQNNAARHLKAQFQGLVV